TRDELERRRRLGTILGAFLIAGLGLVLAASVGSSTALQFVDVEGVKPWAVTKVALGNAALILGLSTCLESLYWVWRELRLCGWVLDWAPGISECAVPILRGAPLWDPHFGGEGYGYRRELGTRGPGGDESIQPALQKLFCIDRHKPLDRVLITG